MYCSTRSSNVVLLFRRFCFSFFLLVYSSGLMKHRSASCQSFKVLQLFVLEHSICLKSCQIFHILFTKTFHACSINYVGKKSVAIFGFACGLLSSSSSSEFFCVSHLCLGVQIGEMQDPSLVRRCFLHWLFLTCFFLK